VTYFLMILLCAGHGADADCAYIPYHGMRYDTLENCQIAMDFVQKGVHIGALGLRVERPDVAPEMACILFGDI